MRGPEARLAEFTGLCHAIPIDLMDAQTLRLKQVRPATYIGGGQVAALAERAAAEDIDLLLVDTQLSPIQQRNLERATGTKVLDRTALILEIFGARASTREGVLQVELAHLNYQKSRLVRSWTHLERQRGGGGFLGGPGETQIESDRRQLQDRIATLEARIEKVRRTRAVQRKPRQQAPFPVVAIVGYTNAGKSSLFNRLTGAKVVSEDQLFATLDTTVRRLDLPHGKIVMLSDTVGFVSDLPTDLIAAFRATLEEVVDADVILHVRDVSSPDCAAQAADVIAVLADLGVSGTSVPIIEVHNKTDRLSAAEYGEMNVLPAGAVAATVAVSALKGRGIQKLLAEIEQVLASGSHTYRFVLPHAEADKLGWLYQRTEILDRTETDAGTEFRVRVKPAGRDGFMSRFASYLSPSATV